MGNCRSVPRVGSPVAARRAQAGAPGPAAAARTSSTAPAPTGAPVDDGTEMKILGNNYFSLNNFDKAIACYTRAIAKNSSCPDYYANRGMALFRLGKFDDCIGDCLKALELQPNHMKAHFYIGQSLCESGKLELGLAHLQETLKLTEELGFLHGEAPGAMLQKWRQRKLSLEEGERLAEQSKIQKYLNRLILEDAKKKMRAIRKDFAKDLLNPEFKVALKKITAESESIVKQLDELIIASDEQRRKREVPDYLCGKISCVLLRDPVITPGGITYERKHIEEHLLKLGQFDPITGGHLTVAQLIPNYAMKEVVSAFLAKNEWAADM